MDPILTPPLLITPEVWCIRLTVLGSRLLLRVVCGPSTFGLRSSVVSSPPYKPEWRSMVATTLCLYLPFSRFHSLRPVAIWTDAWLEVAVFLQSHWWNFSSCLILQQTSTVSCCWCYCSSTHAVLCYWCGGPSSSSLIHCPCFRTGSDWWSPGRGRRVKWLRENGATHPCWLQLSPVALLWYWESQCSFQLFRWRAGPSSAHSLCTGTRSRKSYSHCACSCSAWCCQCYCSVPRCRTCRCICDCTFCLVCCIFQFLRLCRCRLSPSLRLLLNSQARLLPQSFPVLPFGIFMIAWLDATLNMRI